MPNQNSTFTDQEIKAILKVHFGIEGAIKFLPGEVDYNYKIITKSASYILKISRPDTAREALDFQAFLLKHLVQKNQLNSFPQLIHNLNGDPITEITDKESNKRFVRLLNWIEGRIWKNVNPKNNNLLYSLGMEAGKITHSLMDFKHSFSTRILEWDLANALWTKAHFNLFEGESLNIFNDFLSEFENNKQTYNTLRKSVVHNDVNDYNILVESKLIDPKVSAIIDYGDAVFTQTINDLAITIAYATMEKIDPLDTAIQVLKGYHSSFKLNETELNHLYNLVGIRLIISLTKSAINKVKEPENEYLLISEKPAIKLLHNWSKVNAKFATYSFKKACGFNISNTYKETLNELQSYKYSLSELFPNIKKDELKHIDLSVESTWLGAKNEYEDFATFKFKIEQLQKDFPDKILSGGYLECRPLYTTDAYKIPKNSGFEHRTIHLGIDFWLPERTEIKAIKEGIVFSIFNNDYNKDYGPTLILLHQTDTGKPFYTLYGHLSIETLSMHKVGNKISAGETIAQIGNQSVNGNWIPHLHFQIILDMLGFKNNFPGVCLPSELEVWKQICPDPLIIFNQKIDDNYAYPSTKDLLFARKKNLGKSLSLSYKKPLEIIRGEGASLIDINGQKYLDTVNNVAHVGHEHPMVVSAGQKQMALLNTNTRYLHKNIIKLSEKLLNTFPKELSVVHFVNSGSEANELAIRMAKCFTNQKDFIAIEIGYHGNTNGCIDISSYKFDSKGGSGKPTYTHIVPLPDSYRGLYQGNDTATNYVSHFDHIINDIKNAGRNIAGFFCESIISCGGQIELPKGYLKKAYKKIRKAGGICIADEVQVGFGRVGSHYWGFQTQDVIPDIVTVGKPFGNGHPLAAVICTEEIANAFNNGMEYFNTFGGNPVSCAIGLEVMNIIEKQQLQKNALEVGNYLKFKLKEIQNNYPIIGDIRGKGLFLGIEFVDKSKNPLPKQTKYISNRFKDFNILTGTDGKDQNVIKIKPPMVFSKENADAFLNVLTQILQEDFITDLEKT